MAWLTRFVPLQAKKPKTRISPPRAERGTECPGIAIGCPSVLSNLPWRGPIRTQPNSAQTAENEPQILIPKYFSLYNYQPAY